MRDESGDRVGGSDWAGEGGAFTSFQIKNHIIFTPHTHTSPLVGWPCHFSAARVVHMCGVVGGAAGAGCGSRHYFDLYGSSQEPDKHYINLVEFLLFSFQRALSGAASGLLDPIPGRPPPAITDRLRCRSSSPQRPALALSYTGMLGCPLNCLFTIYSPFSCCGGEWGGGSLSFNAIK